MSRALVACALASACACQTPTATQETEMSHGKHGHGPVSGAQGGAHGAHGAPAHAFNDAARWTAVFDDPARDAWQRPAAVIDALALAPTHVVADVGAGTGYFTVRLARAVPAGSVVAVDVEADMVRFVRERAAREGLTNVSATLAGPAASGLAAESVDRVLVVHVWHHLDGRVAYARDLRAALRPGGKLVIVEFAPGATRGPPPAMRVAPTALLEELRAAGFDAAVHPAELPDQYVVVATRAG